MCPYFFVVLSLYRVQTLMSRSPQLGRVCSPVRLRVPHTLLCNNLSALQSVGRVPGLVCDVFCLVAQQIAKFHKVPEDQTE